MNNNQKYIMRCLELAERGYGYVHPNPMVGCVVVKDGKIVGEGYHRRFGGDHAEIAALKKAGRAAVGSTLYVNLEPCAHHGKTPPCVNAIIAAGIKTVVTSTQDPNPLVGGRGFRALRKAGIKVINGISRDEAKSLNEKFFTFMESGLPFVGLKIAQTIDGRIADRAGTSKWITSDLSRGYAHLLRSGYDAVLVGAGTVRSDDPLLTVRAVEGRNPRRVILDGSFSISLSARVVRDRSAETIILTSSRAFRTKTQKAVALERKGVQVLGLDSGTHIEPRRILKALAGLDITSVMLEGGGSTIRPFLEKRLVNRIHCFVAPKLLGSGLQGIQMNGLLLRTVRTIEDMEVSILGDDILLEGTLR